MIDLKDKSVLSIGKVAEFLGVHPQTLRNWERNGRLAPDYISPGGTRRYKLTSLMKVNRIEFSDPTDNKKTIAYARVSSHDQKSDLDRQAKVLELYCAQHGYDYELIKDLGSGMNYQKKGLQKLLNMILQGDVGRLVITHKDRLLRFGAELIFSICEAKQVEVIILNKGDEQPSFEEELAKDVLEIITVFSARLYGSRSKKNKKIIADLEQLAKVGQSI